MPIRSRFGANKSIGRLNHCVLLQHRAKKSRASVGGACGIPGFMLSQSELTTPWSCCAPNKAEWALGRVMFCSIGPSPLVRHFGAAFWVGWCLSSNGQDAATRTQFSVSSHSLVSESSRTAVLFFFHPRGSLMLRSAKRAFSPPRLADRLHEIPQILDTRY